MVNKAFALVAGAASYLLGGRADRERFDRIKEQATRIWNPS